jgi:thiol-disulfide isomerase/thioredoxin
MDALISVMIADGPAPKRPPHRLLVEGSECDMVRYLLVLLLVLMPGLALAGTAAAHPLQAQATGPFKRLSFERAGTSAPLNSFTAPNGQITNLADIRAKVKVVNLWASWCAPCIEELPSLARLQAAFNPADVRVVAISLDRGGWRHAQKAWTRADPDGLTPYLDKSMGWGTAVAAKGLPLTVIYDAKNREVARLAAPVDWGSPHAKRIVQLTLARSKY